MEKVYPTQMYSVLGDTAAFNMTFISLRNTPLDVYFLTDVSASLQFTINSLRRDILIIGMSLLAVSVCIVSVVSACVC